MAHSTLGSASPLEAAGFRSELFYPMISFLAAGADQATQLVTNVQEFVTPINSDELLKCITSRIRAVAYPAEAVANLAIPWRHVFPRYFAYIFDNIK